MLSVGLGGLVAEELVALRLELLVLKFDGGELVTVDYRLQLPSFQPAISLLVSALVFPGNTAAHGTCVCPEPVKSRRML